MDKAKEIYVSVFVLTYNQEEFIGQTIESILDQETNFKIQLVIGEDCSTDNTRSICEKYASEYPEKIKLLPSKKNHGLIKNFIRTYKECEGKYVAICDGDDYWTDPLKLQKQVDFLESNSDYSIVSTSFKFLFLDGRMIEKDYSNQSTNTNFEDLISGNYISSVTAVFRNKKTAADFPDWLDTCPYGDWPLYLWTTRDGSKIKFLKDITAVYRKKFVLELEKIGKKMDSEVILCPIGLASGHEDHVVLKEFCEIGDKLRYYHPKSIYEIMTLLTFSRAYLGTSLHGLITAQSYGVPFIPLNPRLKKVEGYCQTWTSGNIEKPMDFAEIINAPEIIAKWNYKVAKVNLKEQKALVYQNFKEIFENFD